MYTRTISAVILAAYSALLIKVMVFKSIPTIRVGQLMLNFGGTQGGEANYLPFKTILPYLFGHKGLLIAGINLVGNIVLLVPVGFLVPLIYRNVTWKQVLILAGASGLLIETAQVILRVGIFDIDDVILNGLGVMIGYWSFVYLDRWVRAKNDVSIAIAAVVIITAVAAAVYVVYPWGQPVSPTLRTSDSAAGEVRVPDSDLCGGTGGIGEIVRVESSTFIIRRKDGDDQTVYLTDQPVIETQAGFVSSSELKSGDRVTLVGEPNMDGSFTAHAVVVCTSL